MLKLTPRWFPFSIKSRRASNCSKIIICIFKKENIIILVLFIDQMTRYLSLNDVWASSTTV